MAMGQSGLGRPGGQVDEHVLLTAKGCIRSRGVWRIPDGNQASYHAEVKQLPWGTLRAVRGC